MAKKTIHRKPANPAGNNLVHALEDTGTPEKTREWLHAVVGAALRAARRHRGRVPQARNEPAREGVRRGGSQAEGRYVMATPRRSDRPGLLLWLNTTVKLRACLIAERGVTREEMTVRPEDTLRAAGISSKRQARYQQRMSSLLAGR